MLAACGSERPIAQTAEAAAPVIESSPGVSFIYGRWALDPASCSIDSTARFLTIGEGRLEAQNYTCTMTTPEVNGEGWLVTLECAGASPGVNVVERVRFVPDQGALVLNYIDRTQNNDQRLARCP